MEQSSIIVKDLSVKMPGRTMLDHVSFALQPGQHLAILGESGSGKTTLAKAIANKIHFTGSITNALHSSIELVEQRYVFKNLSGITDFYYQQRFNSFDANDAPTISEVLSKKIQTNKAYTDSPALIENILTVLEIDHLKDSPLIQLSSGEHKRFQLAHALLNPPSLLILDSPYIGLDITIREKLNGILGELAKKGTQMILIPGTFPLPDYITHVLSIEKGNICFFGAKENYSIKDLTQYDNTETTYDDALPPSSDEDFQEGTVVKMDNVHIKYGNHTIVQNLNWEVKQGEKWLLKGRNGAGKSSVLSLITGDHPQAYANEIYLFGKKRGSGESIWDIKKKTGYVSPELHAYFDKTITCYQAIGSGYFDTIGLYRKLTTDQHKKILQWLNFLKIAEVQNKPMYSIPVSLQRMVLLVRTLIKDPPLLILDEPCQGLDYKQSIQFISLIDYICLHSKKTVIYVSHDESIIPHCVQKVLQLEKGNYKIYSISNAPARAVA